MARRAFVPADKMVVTGYPVRAEIRAALRLTKAEALAKFGLEPKHGRPCSCLAAAEGL